MKPVAGDTVQIDGGYPVDLTNDVKELLRKAQHNEYEEFDPVYKTFAETARKEGFPEIASSFQLISKIEQTHGNRFGAFAKLLSEGKLFVSDVKCAWMCLNCGHIHEGLQAPKVCPVCSHDQGFFIRLEMAPYGGNILRQSWFFQFHANASLRCGYPRQREAFFTSVIQCYISSLSDNFLSLFRQNPVQES